MTDPSSPPNNALQDQAVPDKKITPHGLGLRLKGLGRVGSLIARAGDERLFHFVDTHLTQGTLKVEMPSGNTRIFDTDKPGPKADIHFKNWRGIRRLFAEGVVGFGDSYINGDWETSDLAALIEISAMNKLGLRDELRGAIIAQIVQRISHAVRHNSRENSRKNIAAHYDVGNDFYESWLDETMTYSSALYPREDASLAEAQRNKYNRLLDLIDPKPGERVLEIGCGWGGFAEHAARERGVEVTSITISEEQHKYATERMRRAGLHNQVSIELRDYRDVTETYDHVASIEMFEAVGERYWPTFFDKVASSLRSGGRAALQVITINEDGFETYRKKPDFIQTHIFPGGMLPSVKVFRDHVTKAGMRVLDEAFFADHYARTLKEWRDRFDEAVNRHAFDGLDERFRRLWRFYLAYCEGGFRARTIDLMQVSLTK